MIVVDPAPALESFSAGFGLLLFVFLTIFAVALTVGTLRRLLNV